MGFVTETNFFGVMYSGEPRGRAELCQRRRRIKRRPGRKIFRVFRQDSRSRSRASERRLISERTFIPAAAM